MAVKKSLKKESTASLTKVELWKLKKIIDISDPVCTFCEVMDQIDLQKYLIGEDYSPGRPKYDRFALLKVILFAFTEEGYASLRKIEKLCKTDI